MPDIKPEVNKEPERDKKAAGGLLARLFGGGSGGAGGLSAGVGGVGAGGLSGAAAGGGVLATKAGLLALVLVGTTVAGGVGVVGYRLFGPPANQDGSSNLSLFAPRPKSDSSASAGQAAPASGNSDSLSMLAKGNAAPGGAAPAAAGAAASAAPTDKTAASGVAENAVNGPINSTSNAIPVRKGLLHARKIGTLSSAMSGMSGGGGSTASVANHLSGPSSAGAVAETGTHGASSAMSGHGRASLAHGRGIAGRRVNGALRQALGVRGDQRGAASSYAAGRTYDGSAAGDAGITGPAAGMPGVGGSGTGTTAAQPKTLPNGVNDKTDLKAPPTPPTKEVTPWKNAITEAQAMMTIAALLLMIVGKIHTIWIRKVIDGIVMALGAAIIALGAQISGGQYGQKLQGGVLAAAGAGLILAAMWSYGNTSSSAAKAGMTDKTSGVGGAQALSDPGMKDASGGTGLFGMNPYVLLGGGAALVGLAGTMLKPPKTYPSQQFQNGNPPDTHWFGYQEPPSTTALKTMVAFRTPPSEPLS
jgi:hypothetical protein